MSFFESFIDDVHETNIWATIAAVIIGSFAIWTGYNAGAYVNVISLIVAIGTIVVLASLAGSDGGPQGMAVPCILLLFAIIYNVYTLYHRW